MRHIAFFFCLAAVAAASSCSSEDGEPDSPDAFCERFAEAACNTEVVQACQAADTSACRSSQVAFCLGQLPASGFSGETADECLDAVETAYADADLDAAELGTVARFEAPCDRLVRGPGLQGAVCSDRRDCDAPAGFECVLQRDQITGTCERAVPTGPGEDCSAVGSVCTEGFYCDGSHCIAGESLGEACITHEQCGVSGYCGLLSECEARLPVRSPCGFDEQCSSGLCYQLSATEQVCTDRVRLSLSEPLCDDLR
jgi:hypothetical protein